MIIGGAIAYVVGVLYSVALSVKRDLVLPVAGFISPQIFLAVLRESGAHSAALVTSLWKFVYYEVSDTDVWSLFKSILTTGGIRTDYADPLLQMAQLFSSLVLFLSLWLLAFDRVRPRLVAALAILNIGLIVAVALQNFQVALSFAVDFVVIPTPILALGALILAWMWPRMTKNENQ